MSSYIIKGLLSFFKLLAKGKRFLPAGLSSLFILFTFFYEIFTLGFAVAFVHMAQQLFAMELTINKAVTLAIQNSPDYNLWSFLSIISSVFILYIFVKYLAKAITSVAGSQSSFGTYLVALAFTGVIETSVARMTEGVWGLIPFWDGVIFLFMNLDSVFGNIHWF